MRRSYLLLLPAFTLSILLLAFAGCARIPDFWEEAKAGQKKILVTFPPLYCITHAVAGDDAYVLCMLTSQGPHDYDAAPTDPLTVAGADLVISNGLGLDDGFVKKMLDATQTKVATLNVGRVLKETDYDLLLDDKGHLHPDGEVHKHGDHDPHIWLGPRQAIAMTKIIAAKLAEIDPARTDAYAARAKMFIAKLTKIEEDGHAAFKDKKHKHIVTLHDSFRYFAKTFRLEVSPIQVKPGADPDAGSMARLVERCVTEQVKVIAVEPQYTKAQAETLRNAVNQRQANIAIIDLDPLETAPKATRFNPDKDYYLTKMRENIDTLARALP